MKNYSTSQILSDLSGAITVKGKVIQVDKLIGINSWGKLDYLRNYHGYTLVSKVQ